MAVFFYPNTFQASLPIKAYGEPAMPRTDDLRIISCAVISLGYLQLAQYCTVTEQRREFVEPARSNNEQLNENNYQYMKAKGLARIFPVNSDLDESLARLGVAAIRRRELDLSVNFLI